MLKLPTTNCILLYYYYIINYMFINTKYIVKHTVLVDLLFVTYSFF